MRLINHRKGIESSELDPHIYGIQTYDGAGIIDQLRGDIFSIGAEIVDYPI